MHIFVATDGTLDAEAAADAVARVWREGDEVTVFTAIRFPKRFMRTYGEIAGVSEITAVADAVGAGPMGLASGARAAEELSEGGTPRKVDPQQVSGVQNFFQVVTDRHCAPIVDALAARDIASKASSSSTEDQPARTILSEVNRVGAEMLIVGHKGEGGFEGLLGSTVTKLVRRSPVSVLVLK